MMRRRPMNATGWTLGGRWLSLRRSAANARVGRVVPHIHDDVLTWTGFQGEDGRIPVSCVRWELWVGSWVLTLHRSPRIEDSDEDVRVGVKLGRRCEGH